MNEETEPEKEDARSTLERELRFALMFVPYFDDHRVARMLAMLRQEQKQTEDEEIRRDQYR